MVFFYFQENSPRSRPSLPTRAPSRNTARTFAPCLLPTPVFLTWVSHLFLARQQPPAHNTLCRCADTIFFFQKIMSCLLYILFLYIWFPHLGLPPILGTPVLRRCADTMFFFFFKQNLCVFFIHFVSHHMPCKCAVTISFQTKATCFFVFFLYILFPTTRLAGASCCSVDARLYLHVGMYHLTLPPF